MTTAHQHSCPDSKVEEPQDRITSAGANMLHKKRFEGKSQINGGVDHVTRKTSRIGVPGFGQYIEK